MPGRSPRGNLPAGALGRPHTRRTHGRSARPSPEPAPPAHPFPPEAPTWGARGRLGPEGGRLGPSRVQRGPTPGPGGPVQQVGDVGLPPDRHPPEVVGALAAAGAGFAQGSALSPALVRTQVSARRAPEGQPEAGGCRLHARARRRSRGVTGGCSARRPCAAAAPWRASPRPFLPGTPRPRREFAQLCLRLPRSPDAAAAATRLGRPPPPPLGSQTPGEAPGATRAARSPGRRSRPRRSRLLRPGTQPRTPRA